MSPEDESPYPSMAEYMTKARHRFRLKLLSMTGPEQIDYLKGVEAVAEAAKSSGIEVWTEEMTMGAMFFASTTRSAFEMIHKVGLVDHRTMNFVVGLAEEQENIIIGLDQGSND